MKFVNILKQLVLEAKNVENLIDTFAFGEKKSDKGKVKKSLMTPEELMVIISNDPTSRIKGLRPETVVNQLYNPSIKDSEEYIQLGLESVEKPGDYVEWIISQLRKLPIVVDQISPFKEDKKEFERTYRVARNLFFEDLFKTKQNLIRFHANKNTDRIPKEMRDIGQYTSFDALDRVVSDLPLETATTTKSERKESRVHPGAKMTYQSPNWDIIEIERSDELGKEAACFYGGNQMKSGKGETNWCTSAPGLSYFKNYISKGPLFVIIPKGEEMEFSKGVTKGEVSGLPAKRYQFHFEDSQFMDPDDRQIDLIKFFGPGGEMEELKEFFKPYFAKKFLSKTEGKGGVFRLVYPDDQNSKYAMIYGMDSLIDQLPNTINKFEIMNKSSSPVDIKIDEDFVKKFPDIFSLHLENVVSELPKNIGDLSKMQFLAVTNSKNLTEIPESIDKLIDKNTLTLVSFAGSNPNLKIPPKLKEAIDNNEILGYLPE